MQVSVHVQIQSIKPKVNRAGMNIRTNIAPQGPSLSANHLLKENPADAEGPDALQTVLRAVMTEVTFSELSGIKIAHVFTYYRCVILSGRCEKIQ